MTALLTPHMASRPVPLASSPFEAGLQVFVRVADQEEDGEVWGPLQVEL